MDLAEETILLKEVKEAVSDNIVQMYAEIERHLWWRESCGHLVRPSHTEHMSIQGLAAAVVKIDLKTVPAPQQFRWMQT